MGTQYQYFMACIEIAYFEIPGLRNRITGQACNTESKESLTNSSRATSSVRLTGVENGIGAERITFFGCFSITSCSIGEFGALKP